MEVFSFPTEKGSLEFNHVKLVIYIISRRQTFKNVKQASKHCCISGETSLCSASIQSGPGF